jgi:hypothetical protein
MTRTIRIHATGGPEALQLDDVPLPTPGPGEALVRHSAIGVNFIDTYHRSGLYPLPLPSGIGSEAAGVIEAVGPGVTDVAVGQRVAYSGGPPGSYAEARVIADEQLSGPALEMVQRRLDLWLAQHVKKLLGALAELETGEGLEGIARGIAFQTAEALGVLERSRVASDIKSLDQNARGALRKLGVRFGAHHL